MARKIILLFFLPILLLSCSVDPQYSLKNPIHIPDGWHTKDKFYSNQKAQLASMPWWKQFRDPTLNHLVSLALHRNQNIFAAVGNVEAAQGELKRVELNWVPKVDGMLGYSSFPYLGYPGVLAVAGPAYVINFFSQIKEQQRAHAALRLTKAMRDSVKITVISEMVRSYLSYLASVEQLKLLQRIESDLRHMVRITHATYRGGLSTNIELSKTRTALNLILAKERVVKNNIVHSEHAINYLLNKNPGSFKTKRRFHQINGDNVVIGRLPVNVLENRPDMVEAIAGIKLSNADIGLALSHFLPTFSFNVARGDIATLPNGSTLGTPVYFNEILLKQPVITLSTFGELDKVRGLNKAAYYRYVNTLRQALRDVNNDLSSHEQFTHRLKETTEAEHHTKEVYNLNLALYEQGIISYQELLKPKIEYDEILVLLNRHKLQQLFTIIKLYQDMALGYNYQNRC